MHGIIDKSEIFGLIGSDNYQEEVLMAKLNLQTAKNKHHKDFKEKAFFNKVLTLPNAFQTLCQMHQNNYIDNNDLKASKPNAKHILALPEDTLVYILNTGIFSDIKISSYDLVKQYGKNLSGDKCILLAKQGFINPEDLINTINMESVSKTSPELAIDPIALINFYEPEVLLDMYKKDKSEGKYGKRLSKNFINTFNQKLLSRLPEEEQNSLIEELIRKTQELEKDNSTEILFDFYKLGLLPNSSLNLFLDEDEIDNLYINEKVDDKDLLNFYKAGLLSQTSIYDFFSTSDIIENVANGTFEEKDLLAIPETKRVSELSKAYLSGKLQTGNILHMFLEHNVFSIEELNKLFEEKKPEEDLSTFVTKDSNPEKIKELFLNYHISYEDLTTLRNNGLLSNEDFENFSNAIDKNKFYEDLKHSNLILHSLSGNVQTLPTGRYYSGEPKTSSKIKTDFDLEKEALQMLLDTPDFNKEKDSIPIITSLDENGKPTSLDGYACIPIYKYGLVIFEKFARSNSLFIMPYQQADYFLHGNMNFLDSSFDINSKNKKTLSQMSSVIVRQHTKHFLKNVLDATIKLNPEAKKDLKPNGKYSQDAMYYINEMENFYIKASATEKTKEE